MSDSDNHVSISPVSMGGTRPTIHCKTTITNNHISDYNQLNTSDTGDHVTRLLSLTYVTCSPRLMPYSHYYALSPLNQLAVPPSLSNMIKKEVRLVCQHLCNVNQITTLLYELRYHVARLPCLIPNNQLTIPDIGNQSKMNDVGS
jgi:hypothetical protein